MLRKKLHNFQIPKGSDPVQKMLEIEDHAEQMRDAGMHVNDQDIYCTYVSALPSEYDLEIRELGRKQVGAAGVDALAVSEGVKAAGVATVGRTAVQKRTRSPETVAMPPRPKSSRQRGRYALIAVAEATLHATAR